MICVSPFLTLTWSKETAKWPRLVTSLPEPPDSAIVPMGLKSIVTCSATPSASLTLRTSTVSDVEPPLQNFDMSATASPDGVTPLIAAPVNVSFADPHPPPPPEDVWELSERTDGAVGLGAPSWPPHPAAITNAAIAMAAVIFVTFMRTQPPRPRA